MVQLNLASNSFNFQVAENKIVPSPSNNEGSPANNIKKTTDNIWNAANLLKTHKDQKTPENVKLLREYVQAVQTEANNEKNHVPNDVKQKINKAHGLIKSLK